MSTTVPVFRKNMVHQGIRRGLDHILAIWNHPCQSESSFRHNDDVGFRGQLHPPIGGPNIVNNVVIDPSASMGPTTITHAEEATDFQMKFSPIICLSMFCVASPTVCRPKF